MRDDERWRDERAAEMRERDRQREPHRHPRCVIPCRSAPVEPATRETVITQLSCAACRGPVFVPDDSDRESVNCASCDARMVTRQSIDGSVEVTLVGPP